MITIINLLENLSNLRAKQVQADWGGEFQGKELAVELKQRGTTLKETVPYHSETNAIAERMNRTILDMNRTAIAASALPKGMWDKVSQFSAYTKNRIPHKSLNGKSPYEIIHPDRDIVEERKNLRPFGQKVSCYDYKVKDKLSARNYEARIVGYTTSHGTYQVYDNNGKTRLAKSPKPIPESPTSDSSSSDEELETRSPPHSTTPQEILDDILDEIESQTPDVPAEPIKTPTTAVKQRKKKNWPEIVGERKSPRTPKPKIQAVSSDPDHPTNEQARASPEAAEWAKARNKERSQLEKYKVFTKVEKSEIPEGTKIVDTKWVYVIKRKPDGSIEKYKARKVGRGFTQEAGKSYDADKIYAQMMRPETFKMLLVIALYKRWVIRQWDVVAAYLQALLHHDVYVSDVNKDGETEYWKLNKALYGLKQAGHEWFKTLESILNQAGLIQCIGDDGTYRSTNGDQIIGTHVDDLLAIGASNKILDQTETTIEKSVELDKKGLPGQILGMEIKWIKDAVVLTQTRLIETTFHMHFTTPSHQGKSSLPLNPILFEHTNETEEGCPKTQYQAIVGSLLYIARMTRPEISVQVNLLGRCAANPSAANMSAARKVLEYLYSTKQEGIILRKPSNLRLETYANASYGGPGSRSQTGVLITMGGQPVGWYSRRQDIVSLSITEAEYIACCEAAKDLAWGQQFCSEIQALDHELPLLWTDSEGAMNLYKTNQFLRRSRHIEHRFHYLWQQVRQQKMQISWVPGNENPSDILTKLLPMAQVQIWKKKWIGTG